MNKPDAIVLRPLIQFLNHRKKILERMRCDLVESNEDILLITTLAEPRDDGFQIMDVEIRSWGCIQ